MKHFLRPSSQTPSPPDLASAARPPLVFFFLSGPLHAARSGGALVRTMTGRCRSSSSDHPGMPVSTPDCGNIARHGRHDVMSCAGILPTAKPSNFYLVTPFWNLKRVLAPSTRCYCQRLTPAPMPTTTSPARKSAVGLRVGHRDGRRRVSKLPQGLGRQRPGGGAQACRRKLGPLGRGSRSIDGHHVAHESRGPGTSPVANQACLLLASWPCY